MTATSSATGSHASEVSESSTTASTSSSLRGGSASTHGGSSSSSIAIGSGSDTKANIYKSTNTQSRTSSFVGTTGSSGQGDDIVGQDSSESSASSSSSAWGRITPQGLWTSVASVLLVSVVVAMM